MLSLEKDGVLDVDQQHKIIYLQIAVLCDHIVATPTFWHFTNKFEFLSAFCEVRIKPNTRIVVRRVQATIRAHKHTAWRSEDTHNTHSY